MTDTAPDIDPLADAQAELAGYRIMSPEDLLEQLSPNACLFFLQQTAYETMKHWATELTAGEGVPVWNETPVCDAFQVIVTVCGELDEACTLVNLLPPNALDVPDQP
jgi:hypothetical protein